MSFRVPPRSRSHPSPRDRHSAALQDGTGDNGTAEETGRCRPRRRRSWLLHAFCSALIISGLSHYAIERGERAAMPDVETTGALVSPPPAWDPVMTPAVLFAFDMPELELPDMAVEARTYRQGGREDALSIGSAADPFYLRIVLDRSQREHNGSFYIDLARNAARAGLAVRRNTQISEIATKFGTLEAAEATLAGNADVQCLAFRGKALDGKVSMHGWLCGEDRFVADDMLACFLDRLTTTPALRERDLETGLHLLDKGRTAACVSAMERLTAEN